MKIVFATNNSNKIKEIQGLLPSNIEIISLEKIGCYEDIPETANTIEGNSILKANYVTQKYGFDCFADDTGLEVEALNNQPGVYSARYAGPECLAENNMNLLLHNLDDKENRKARFKTVITLNIQGNQIQFTGIAKGEITKNKSGNEGFGYDPIFKPDNYEKTFAEMPAELKNKISHRAKATQELISYLNDLK